MASTLGHGMAAFALGRQYRSKGFSFLFWVLTLLSANIPDADVLSFRFGIPYNSQFGHRGFTHSIVFAVVWSLLMGWIILFNKRSTGIRFESIIGKIDCTILTGFKSTILKESNSKYNSKNCFINLNC